MIKVVALFVFFQTWVFLSMAQSSALSCGNGRYASNVFDNVSKKLGTIFGYNYINGQAQQQTLRFDFYEPASDVATRRPLIILGFGGGFVGGQRRNLDSLCTKLARKGYAVATIDYRLINIFNAYAVYNSEALMADQLVKASADMKAAIRYFKRDAATVDTFKIDPTKIIVGGYSAGAITALQTAFVETDDIMANPIFTTAYANNGGLEGNTDLLAPNNLLNNYDASGIIGVLNISGAVADLNIIDAGNPPLYSVHGNGDRTVPYNSGPLVNALVTTPFLLYGSNAIKDQANLVGLSNTLWTLQLAGHNAPMLEDTLKQIVDQAAAFFQPLVCSNVILPVTLKNISTQANNCSALLRWETATELNNNSFEIEISTDGTVYNKMASVRSKNVANGAVYSYNYQGAAGNHFFRLKMLDNEGSFTYSEVVSFRLMCGGNTGASIQVYPNPASAQTTITGLISGMEVCIYNAEGKLVQTTKVNNSILQLPLPFMNGLYLIQIKDADGNVMYNTKLIKR